MNSNKKQNEELTVRKSIRIPVPLRKVWDPEDIRRIIENDEYEANELFEIPSELWHGETRSMTIWLTETQFDRWDSKKIKRFLGMKYIQSVTENKGVQKRNVVNDIIKTKKEKMIPEDVSIARLIELFKKDSDFREVI